MGSEGGKNRSYYRGLRHALFMIFEYQSDQGRSLQSIKRAIETCYGTAQMIELMQYLQTDWSSDHRSENWKIKLGENEYLI
jgi:hypothetical protein